MEVDALPETLKIDGDGEVLHVDLSKSTDIEYVPPPNVRAWMRHVYGDDVDDWLVSAARAADGGELGAWKHFRHTPQGFESRPVPPTSYIRKATKLRKYWWIDRLRVAPRTAVLGRW